MSSTNIFEIVGLISGQPVSNQAIQSSQNISLGIEQEIGLIILSTVDSSADQSFAIKPIEILFDDMGFNLGNHKNITPQTTSTCLHESIENVNEFLIDQHQRSSLQAAFKGTSLVSIQNHSDGISCSLHGDLCALTMINNDLNSLNSKVSMAKSLGINPNLSFTIIDQSLNGDDLLFIASFSTIEQLGHDFIRLTLSRFKDNLEMAIRQINARFSQRSTTSKVTFVILRKNNAAPEKKGWFK